ncbi:MAG: PEP-CTERM sorting domain-containing protein [Planctomycetota bacterium]
MSSFASAAYNYGTNVQGNAVVYDTIDSDTGLWGNMVVNGDSLLFFPTDFQAGIVSGAGGYDAVDETLQFTMSLKEGNAGNRIIESFTFAEAGHYSLDGIGTVGTDALVSSSVIFTILEIDDVAVTAPLWDPLFYIVEDALTFTSDGDYDLATEGDTGGLADWNGSLVHNFAADGFGGSVTKIHVSVNNYLEVHSETGTSSFIEKKVGLNQPAVSISPVIPEPATLALLGLGGLLLRRKK